MADNVDANPATGGATFAADDIGGVKFPRAKITIGADGTNDGDVAAGNPLPVTAASLPLPSGAATSAKQPALGTAGTASTDVISIQGIASMTAVAVSAASLPLPTGASTSAKQPALGTAGSASADVITVQGVASMTPLLVNASGNAVPITDNSGSITVDNAGTFSVQASSVVPGVAATSLGKAEDAAHSSGDTGVMVLAVRSDTAAATAGTDGDYQPPITDASGRLWVNASGAAVPITDNSGSLTVDGSVTVTQGTATNLKVDASGVAVPVTDNAGSLTVDYATTGSGTATGALRVELANNGTGVLATVGAVTAITNTVTTKEVRSGTATTSQVADTASSTTILASNAARLGASVHNDSSAVLYLKCGTTASATDYTVRMVQYAYWEAPFGFTGRIDGIWASDPNDGAARVTEFT